MAEVIGVIGSAVGIMAFGLQACKGLILYYKSYKDSRSDVARMVASLEGLAATLKTLQEPFFKTTFSKTQVENITSKIEDCEESMMEFTEVLRKITESDTSETVGGRSIGFRDRFKEVKGRLVYPFRESTILKLQETVNYVAGNLGLAMQSMQLSAIPKIHEKLDGISQAVNELVMSQEDEKTKTVLKWLSTINCNARQEEILSKREEGTGMWLFETQEYKDWFDGKNKVLWGSGGPGVGKTVLSSAVINETQLRTMGTNSCTAFLFCNYAERGTQTLEELLGSIAQQLLRKHTKIPLDVLRDYQHYTSSQPSLPKSDVFRRIILTAAGALNRVYIIIDALDECHSDIRIRLVTLLLNIGARVRLFYTSRYMGEDVAQLLRGALQIKIRGSDEDVRTYLRAQIRSQTNLVRLCSQHEGLSEKIIDGVAQKTDGMFLLAHFHIEALSAELRVKHLLKTLATLPGSLKTTYQDAIDRIFKGQDKRKTDIAMKVLLWATFSRRPLNVQEMQHAISAMELDDEDNIIDIDDLYHKEILVTSCAGLIHVDESNTVRLVHYSIQEYLMKERDSLFPTGYSEILKTCMKYLSMDLFLAYEPGNEKGDFQKAEAQYNDLVKDFPLLNYSCKSWRMIFGSKELAESLSDEILQFVHNKYSRGFTLILSDALFFHQEEKFFETFLQSRLKEKVLRVVNCFSINPLGKIAALIKTAIFDYPVLTEMLLEDGEKVERNVAGDVLAIHLAAFTGHEKVLKELLRKNARIDLVCNTNWGERWTALHLASTQGFTGIAKKLIKSGADVNARDSEGRTPLIVATRWSYIATFIGEVKEYFHLIDELAGKGGDLSATDLQGRNALFWPTTSSIERFYRSHDIAEKDKASQVAVYPLYIDPYINEILLTIHENSDLPEDDDDQRSWILPFLESAVFPTIPKIQKYPNQSHYRDVLLSIPADYFPVFPEVLRNAIGSTKLRACTIILKHDGSSILLKGRKPSYIDKAI